MDEAAIEKAQVDASGEILEWFGAASDVPPLACIANTI